MKFAILTPSFQYGRFISDCITSVGNQSSDVSTTHIIQDAGSTDDTSVVVAAYRDSFSLIFQSEPDAGQSDAMNKALQRAGDADYVGWLNADEFYMPDAFDHIRRAADSNPDASVIFGDCLFSDEAGRLVRAVPAHRMSRRVLRNYGSFLSSCAVFIRRDALADEPWDVMLREAMDWDLWLTLSERGRFVYIPQPIGVFRVHSAQVTQLGTKLDAHEAARIRNKHRIRNTFTRQLLARSEHILLKIANGSYVRQAKFRCLRGTSLVWWGASH